MCLIRNRSFNFGTFKKFIIVTVCSVALLFYEIFLYSASVSSYFDYHFPNQSKLNNSIEPRNIIVENFYRQRQSWPTSNLGSILFKNVNSETFKNDDRSNKTFIVLIWEHWKWLRGRHVHGFNKRRNSNPVDRCSVTNCMFTGNNDFLDTADAVVIHIQKGVFPNQIGRKPEQRWIFLNDESPIHAFSMASKKPKLSSLANMFNWSMTYRSDADIPVPYGRTIPLSAPSRSIVPHTATVNIPYWKNKQKDVLAAILISNCMVSHRMRYLNELKQHLAVDVHGKCSENNKTSCPGHFRSDCGIMTRYLFYLVFENSMCKEYLTEKGFYHAYSKGAIPVIMGPSLNDCYKLLPPNSYLHVDSFKTPLDLANEIINISMNLDRLLSFHQWRNYFRVVNEHGYFGSRSFHLCRVCEALNYNDQKEKIYSEDDIEEFLDASKTCR